MLFYHNITTAKLVDMAICDKFVESSGLQIIGPQRDEFRQASVNRECPTCFSATYQIFFNIF